MTWRGFTRQLDTSAIKPPELPLPCASACKPGVIVPKAAQNTGTRVTHLACNRSVVARRVRSAILPAPFQARVSMIFAENQSKTVRLHPINAWRSGARPGVGGIILNYDGLRRLRSRR